MTKYVRRGTPLAQLLTLLLAFAVLAVVPPAPARAGIEFDEPVDDVIDGEFATGSLSLTSLTSPAEEPVANRGAVELAQIGNLQWFTPGSAENFPSTITEPGVATIGNNIYVAGGEDGLGGGSPRGTAKVFRTIVNTASGQLGAWQEQTGAPLPSVAHDSLIVAPTDRRFAPAMASYATNAATGNGFLYVIGGSVRPGSSGASSGQNGISSTSVVIGTVTNGAVTGWVEGPRVASTPFENCPIEPAPCGVAGAAAFVWTTPANRTFLYVIGGRQTYAPTVGSSRETTYSDRIFYAEIVAGGGLVQPGTTTPGWVVINSSNRIPVDPAFPTEDSNVGLFNTAVIGDRFTNPTDGTTQDAMFIIGGETGSSTSTAQVFKYRIEPDGQLVADGSGTPGAGIANNAVAATARNQHGAFLWRNTTYYAGGRSGTANPDNSTFFGLIEEDRTFTRFGNQVSGAFFVPNYQAFNLDLSDTGRTLAGYALVPSNKLDGAGNPRTAWVYVIGGRNAATTARNTVFRGEIGVDPPTPNYPPDGYFVGRPRRIQAGSEVDIKEIVWRTERPNNTDIRIEFRTSTGVGSGAEPCQAVDVPWSAWQEADGDADGDTWSVDGNNSYGSDIDLNLSAVNCFQYRAQLRGNGFPTFDVSTETPTLFALSIVVILPGSPDLRFADPGDPKQAVEVIRNGNEVRLEVNVLNRNDFELPTRAASYGRLSWDQYQDDQFFVDLFLYPPGVTPPTPHPQPPLPTDPLLDYNRVYAKIRFSDVSVENMPVEGITRTILGNEWCNASIGPQCVLVNPLSLMQGQVGTWKVVVVVDSGPDRTTPYVSTGLVRETSGSSIDTRAENNNVSLAFDVQILADDVIGDPVVTYYCPADRLCIYTPILSK